MEGIRTVAWMGPHPSLRDSPSLTSSIRCLCVIEAICLSMKFKNESWGEMRLFVKFKLTCCC